MSPIKGDNVITKSSLKVLVFLLQSSVTKPCVQLYLVNSYNALHLNAIKNLNSMNRNLVRLKATIGSILLWTVALPAVGDDIDAMINAGKKIYTKPGACVVCHLENGSGNPAVNAKDLRFGPTPQEIHNALISVPQMGPVGAMLNLDNDGLLTLSTYIQTLGSHKVDQAKVDELRTTLDSINKDARDAGFALSERDKAIDEFAPFQAVLDTWKRKAKAGNIMHSYEAEVVQTWEPAKPRFKPQPGKTYFYQNTGARGRAHDNGSGSGAGNAITVGDAETYEVIAQGRLDKELRGSVHTTAMTPDGRYGYIIGPSMKGKPGKASMPTLKGTEDLAVTKAVPSINVPATLIKWDALSLEPVKMFTIGGRLHHLQIFDDKYMLADTFYREDDGLDVFLFDPKTDKIVGGVRDEELGGSSYTAFTDNKFIYVLMQPSGYGPMSLSGFIGASLINYGKYSALRPFWVAKIDPNTWEVVREYPYPGYRGDWICFDAKKENMFIPAAATSNVTKINLETGNIEWVNPTGIGPYGCNVSADDKELWIADKGEANGAFGRTVTVLKTEDGKAIATLPSAYMVDHVLLSPNGKEFWATSNAEGRLYVFDSEEKELITKIEIPGGGDAHGLPWVYYDKKKGKPKVARDQGGFRNGIDPRNGKALNY